MSRRHAIAVAVGLATMLIALIPPLWIRSTGEEVTLALRPIDPLSLFRGNYVELGYDLDVTVPPGIEEGDAFVVVLDDATPANVVRASAGSPDLGEGETCIRARLRFGDNYHFPDIEQYFVTAEQGRDLETRLDDLVGVVKTTGSCRAVLVRLEEPDQAG